MSPRGKADSAAGAPGARREGAEARRCAGGGGLAGEIDALRDEFRSALAGLEDLSDAGAGLLAVEQLRVRFTGRKSTLTALMGRLKTLSGPERAGAGKELNLLKRELESECRRRKEEFARRQRDAELARDWIDVTLGPLLDPAFGAGEGSVPGHLHPTSMIQYEIEDVFTSMGFEILDGPHVETDYFNFEALNIPRHHPARDMQDTFFLEDGNILRSHTSAIQVRGMLDLRPPFKVLGPGKVFRCERTDASHEATFHQLEGMMVDRDISVAHLIYFMKVLLSRIFRREVEVRLRPGYFPFVEPGFELDVRCLICGGDGCAVCKHVGWVELVPCGLVHPNVLRYGKIDAEEFSAFAFGLGLDRLVLMRYQIDDIRLFHGADLRFFHQFR